jgi:uncharacterized protein (TIGR02246 family)
MRPRLRGGERYKYQAIGEVNKLGVIREKIDAVNKGFVEAFNRGDLATAMRVYTEDATILPPNADIMKGKKAITAYWQGALDMGVKEAKLETVEVTPMGDEAACEIGRYVLKIQPEGGEAFTDKGKYMMIWKLVDGSWKWDSDAWNSSLPPT